MTTLAPKGRAAGQGPRAIDLLFRPFTYVAGGRSLLIGTASILAAGLLGGVSGTHLDGVLDLHMGAAAPQYVFVAEGVIDWLVMASVLLVVGKLVSKSAFRFVDLYGTQAMARWPMVVAVSAVLVPSFPRLINHINLQVTQPSVASSLPALDLAVGSLAALVSLLSVIWMVGLMYQSYSICCNIRGGRATASFIVGLIVAEAFSKLLIVRILLA